MLGTFRAHAKGWIAWAFVILVTVPFAFWGIGQYRSLVTTNYVAKVNGEKIMPNDLQQAYNNAYQQRQQQQGDKFNPTPAQEKALKLQTLQQLIENTLLRQQARSDHLVVGTAEVRAQIQDIPQFQVNGHFDFQQYRTVLSSNDMSVPQFESRVRSALILQQLQDGIANSAFPTQKELGSVVALLKEQRRVAWFVLPLEKLKSEATPDDSAIERYYQTHQKQYSTPATVTLAYVRLDQKTLEGKVKISGDDLQNYYDSHQSRYGIPPARKAAEILIKPEGASAKQWAQARAKAQSLLEQVRGSSAPEKTFAELARKDSDDPVSRRNGGSIGYVGRGQMGKNLDHALFGIEKSGGVAGPVRTDKGWVLLQLLAERAGKMRPFAAVKDQVASDYKAAHAKELYYQLGDKLANDAYEHPGSLAPVAKSLGLQVQTLTGVTRDSGGGIAKHEQVRKAAFSDSVLKKHENSAPIKLGAEDAVVLRVASETPSRVKPLSEVRATIVATLRQQQAIAASRQAAAQALAALRGGQPMAAVAKAHGVAAHGPATVSRTTSDLPAALSQAVFSLPPTPSGKPRYATVPLSDGAQAVYALLGVQPGKTQSLSEAESQAYATDLGRMYASEAVADYIASLREHADVKIIANNIQ